MFFFVSSLNFFWKNENLDRINSLRLNITDSYNDNHKSKDLIFKNSIKMIMKDN